MRRNPFARCLTRIGWLAASGLGAAVLCVAAAFGQGPTRPADPWLDYAAVEYDIIPNITYAVGNNVELKLDLYLPKARGAPKPVVMLFHGGGWVAGQKERNVLQLLPYLRLGWAAVNVEYRVARQSPAPAAVEDCRCALRWVYTHAQQYGFDVGKIVLTGGSAGGHLALITGFLPERSVFDRQCPTDDAVRWRSDQEPAVRAAAIVNWYGITDVADLLEGANAKHYAIEWFGSMPNRLELARELSPIQYVRPGLPPVITIHGDQDDIVPYSQAVRLHQALDKAGVPNKLVTIPGGKHGGFDKETMVRAFEQIRGFLRQNGFPVE
jgi:acetyl esterase/lipase